MITLAQYAVVWVVVTLVFSFVAGLVKKERDVVDIFFITFLSILWPVVLPVVVVGTLAVGVSYCAHRLERAVKSRWALLLDRKSLQGREPQKKV